MYCKKATQLYVRGRIRGESANSLGVISKTSEFGPRVHFTFFENPGGRKWNCDILLNAAKFCFDSDGDSSSSDLPADGTWHAFLKIDIGLEATLYLAGRFDRPR